MFKSGKLIVTESVCKLSALYLIVRSPALSPLKINPIGASPSAFVSAVVGAVVEVCPFTVAVTVTPLVGTGLFEVSRKPITGD